METYLTSPYINFYLNRDCLLSSYKLRKGRGNFRTNGLQCWEKTVKEDNYRFIRGKSCNYLLTSITSVSGISC